jgi:hypothetical protein
MGGFTNPSDRPPAAGLSPRCRKKGGPIYPKSLFHATPLGFPRKEAALADKEKKSTTLWKTEVIGDIGGVQRHGARDVKSRSRGFRIKSEGRPAARG